MQMWRCCLFFRRAGSVIWSSRVRCRCRRTGWSIYRGTSWTRRCRTRARPWWRSPASPKTQTRTRPRRRPREAGRPRRHPCKWLPGFYLLGSFCASMNFFRLTATFRSLTRPFFSIPRYAVPLFYRTRLLMMFRIQWRPRHQNTTVTSDARHKVDFI